MTEEDKELLLKDLCARLPYGVKTSTYIPHLEGGGEIIERTLDSMIIDKLYGASIYPNEKPYLRPMSSMTKDEQEEFFDLIICVDNGKAVVEEDKIFAYNNFIYSHHLDNKNFIEKGLALEAPSNMYNIKIETT